MADHHDIQELVEQTVAELFAAHIPELRHEIGEKVMEAIAPKLAEMEAAASPSTSVAQGYPPGGAPTDLLNAAVATIYDSNAQTEILRALLDGLSQFTARAVLFVVKSGNLTAWQSRGFADEGAFKGLTMSGSEGLAGRAVTDKEPVSAAAVEFSGAFIQTHGNPHDGNASVHPLIVRDKVAAVIYTDAGIDGVSDQSAVRVIVRAASSWLEIIALRKSSGSAPAEAAEVPAPPPSPAAAAPPPQAPAAAAKPRADASLDGLSPEDQEIHKKAKRFAKLLVDEIKLYNPAKVTEGKTAKNIYGILREDIEKSRSTYDKRYGSTAVGSGGYFNQELVRLLADGDVSSLGPEFPG